MPRRSKSVEPWERQLNESTPAFEAFSTYLNMGNERTLRRLAQELNKSLTLVGKWSSTWNWQERIRAYDNYLSDIERKAVAKEVKNRYVRFGKASDQLLLAGLAAINSINVNNLSPRDAATFLQLAATLAEKHKEFAMPEGVAEDKNADLLGGLLAAFEMENEEE